MNPRTPRASQRSPSGRRTSIGVGDRAGRVLAGGLLAGSLVSCTKFASELDALEPAEAEDALGGLTPGEPDWSCMSDPAPAAPSDAAAGGARTPLTYALQAVNFISNEAIRDLRVRACFRSDVGCASPALEYVEPAADGRVRVELYAGFNGYLELTSAGMLPALLFFPAPWSSELLAELERISVGLLPAPALQALGESARVQLDPAGGVVGVNTYDCGGSAAPDVRLEIDASAVPYAFVDGLPVSNRDITSEQGLGGFVNVPPGVVVVSGFANEAAEPVSVEALLVRPGWLTTVTLLPRFSL